LPVRYLINISGQGWDEILVSAVKTLTGALGMNLGVIVVVGLVALISRRGGSATSSPGTLDPRDLPLGVLGILTLAPLILTIASALVLRTKITPEMTIGTFALLPLLTIELAGAMDDGQLCRIAYRLAGVVTFGALLLSPVIAADRTFVSSSAMKVGPYQEAAAEATRLWHAHTSAPLAYVGGTGWYENAIAFYSPDRPHVFVHFNYAINLWVTPEALAKHGLLSMCVSDDRLCLAETAGFVTPQTTRTEVSLAHMFWGHTARPVRFLVTIIPPRD
jgi:hypothetical protein